MFKAFTNNISSFIGVGEKKEEEKAAEDSAAGTSESTGNSSASSDPSASQAQVDQGAADAPTERRDSKVPPPRPAPPLTPASSVCKPDTPPASPAKSVEKSGSEAGSAADGSETKSEEGEQKKDRIDEKLEEVAGKAKEWGSYLFSMTKTAGASVSAKAKELKKAVAENTIIGDFAKEQDKFVSEKKEKARANEAAVPPWVGYNEEEQMKEQMLTLSNDKRNFLRNPPNGVQFHFDYDTCYPVAMATLAEDDKLKKMRFDLVPKLVTEHDFWRNYFYRVSLIKQSTQLTSLAKQSSSSNLEVEATKQESQVPETTNQSTDQATTKKTQDSDSAAAGEINDTVAEDVDVGGANDEFISDAYNLEISDEDLMREMEALRASPGADDPEWEQELQKELTDYEVVGDANSIDDAALEKEIMDEMSKSSEDLK